MRHIFLDKSIFCNTETLTSFHLFLFVFSRISPDFVCLFLPDSPVTHPKLDKIEKNESLLDREILIKDAIDNIEVINIKN